MPEKFISLLKRSPIVSPKNDSDRSFNRHHALALSASAGGSEHEQAIAVMLRGWLRYADAYADRFESQICDDYVLGPGWQKIGSGLLELLNGETGRLDCGTVDRIIRDAVRLAGGDGDEL